MGLFIHDIVLYLKNQYFQNFASMSAMVYLKNVRNGQHFGENLFIAQPLNIPVLILLKNRLMALYNGIIKMSVLTFLLEYC